MIHEVSGDILLSHSPVIAHGVAPNDNFHSGLALLLRERFPSMYKDFRHYCQTNHPAAGELWAWAGAAPQGMLTIVSLFTQEGAYDHGSKPGRAHPDSVNHSLKKLRRWIDSEKPASVALPKLATGVGGLAWEVVHPLILQHLSGAAAPVFVYTTYHAGHAAPEVVRQATA